MCLHLTVSAGVGWYGHWVSVPSSPVASAGGGGLASLTVPELGPASRAGVPEPPPRGSPSPAHPMGVVSLPGSGLSAQEPCLHQLCSARSGPGGRGRAGGAERWGHFQGAASTGGGWFRGQRFWEQQCPERSSLAGTQGLHWGYVTWWTWPSALTWTQRQHLSSVTRGDLAGSWRQSLQLLGKGTRCGDEEGKLGFRPVARGRPAGHRKGTSR